MKRADLPKPPKSGRETTELIAALDLATPWLFGFEYSRAESAPTNTSDLTYDPENFYRHPDRWPLKGREVPKFIKPYDCYALVCINAKPYLLPISKSRSGSIACRNCQMERGRKHSLVGSVKNPIQAAAN